MRHLSTVLLLALTSTSSAQIIGGRSERYVSEGLTIDSMLTPSSPLDADEVLIGLSVDPPCRIREVRMVRDLDDGCGRMVMLKAHGLELELMKYYRFNCPPLVLIRCRCVFDD